MFDGLEGTKAAEVCPGPTKKKAMSWEAPLCGIGLKNIIKRGIEDHLGDQGAMAASARNKKKVNIWNQTTVFLQRKGWNWISDTPMGVLSARSSERALSLHFPAFLPNFALANLASP